MDSRVLEKIESALRLGAKSLDLSCYEITTLPPEIGQLISLTEIDLSDNNLTELPPEIGRLSNLTSLNLSGNELSSLPPKIGQLTKLDKLDLGDNNFATLPSEIGQITGLTTLYLDDNNLAILPPEVCQLTSLTTLGLSWNKLRSLPPEIGKLSNLTSLNLSENELSSLPPEMGQLSNLTHLDLSDNQLINLPDKIGQLSKLTYLNLCINKLTTLPSEVLLLPGLRKKWKREVLKKTSNVLFALLLAFAILTGWVLYAVNIDRTQQWPTTEAVVKESHISYLDSEHVGKVTTLSVTYTYEIEGVQYSGKQEWGGERDITPYQAGTLITVYYNPTNHEKSFIKPGFFPITSGELLTLLISLAAMISLGVFVLITLKNSWQQRTIIKWAIGYEWGEKDRVRRRNF